jgi:lantibiotic modifying enzyme
MALLQLNIPHFTSPSDGQIIRDVAGTVVETEELPGLHRARARVESLDEKEIAWQVAMIRQNTETVSRSDGLRPTEPKKLLYSTTEAVLTKQPFLAEADNIADDLTRYAVCRGPSAAWIGLDWLGDSEVSQLMCLGPELYNGVSGIAVFLAAHAAVTGNASSETLALAAIAHLRKMIGSRNAARMARSLGIGGAMGLGSIVYALTVMSKCLHRNDLLDDAVATTELFTDDVIAADNQLDVVAQY